MEIKIVIDDRVVALGRRVLSRGRLMLVAGLAVLLGSGAAVYGISDTPTHQFSAGDTISSSQVNANFQAVYGAVYALENGGVDNAALAPGAVSASKLAAGAVTGGKLAASAFHRGLVWEASQVGLAAPTEHSVTKSAGQQTAFQDFFGHHLCFLASTNTDTRCYITREDSGAWRLTANAMTSLAKANLRACRMFCLPQ